MKEDKVSSRWRRWSPWAGGLVGIAALAWVLRSVDFERFAATVEGADARFLVLVPVAIAAEQLVRAWKWRQLLHPLRTVGSLSLFGAIMAGFFGGLLLPPGTGPVIRSWLVARRHDLKTGTVLATVAVDRLIDGVVFTGFVPVALVFVAVPDPTGGLRAGLGWGAAGSLVFFVLLLLSLAGYRLHAVRDGGWLARCVARFPVRFAAPLQRGVKSFAEGVVWPKETWRRVGIVLASVVIKLIAASHFLWAGLAFGVQLQPAEYLFLLVFLGFLHIIVRVVHLVGGFTLGAIFALGLLGVAAEQALAIALVVQISALLTTAVIGALALWLQGVALGDLRLAGRQARAPSA